MNHKSPRRSHTQKPVLLLSVCLFALCCCICALFLQPSPPGTVAEHNAVDRSISVHTALEYSSFTNNGKPSSLQEQHLKTKLAPLLQITQELDYYLQNVDKAIKLELWLRGHTFPPDIQGGQQEHKR